MKISYVIIHFPFQYLSDSIQQCSIWFASDSVVFLWHCTLYKFTYLLTYLLVHKTRSKPYKTRDLWVGLVKTGFIGSWNLA